MKCDELTLYHSKSLNLPIYVASEVDEAIAELKAENAQLKKKLMPCLNGDCILTCEVVEKYGKENAELKLENECLKIELGGANIQCENLINSATDIMLRQDKANDAKCDEIESLKATHYAEMVDAGMRERRLKRALYKACANWALSTLAWLDCIDQGEPRKWSEMIQKCLKKAEEFK